MDKAGIFQNSWRGAAAEADAIGKQLKRTQPRAAAERRRKRRAAAEADANGEHAAVEADRAAISSGALEQQLFKADAIGEQQLCTESCPAPDY